MKKLLSLILMTAVILSLGAGVIAVTSDESGAASQSVTLTYRIDPNAYAVSIPATPVFTSTTDTFEVTLTEFHSDKGVNCTVTSNNSFNLKLVRADGETNEIPYQLTVDGVASTNAADGIKFTLQKGSAATKELGVAIDSAQLKTAAAGDYRDVLTFNFAPAA